MNDPPTGEPTLANDLSYLSILVSHYCHHDALLWRRVNVIFAIQVAVIAGCWTLGANHLIASLGLLILGMGLSILWLFIFNRDLQTRDENRDLIERTSKRVTERLENDTEQFFVIGNEPVRLAHFPETIGTLWQQFDQGVFLSVPTRSVVMMRIAFVTMILADLITGIGIMATAQFQPEEKMHLPKPVVAHNAGHGTAPPSVQMNFYSYSDSKINSVIPAAIIPDNLRLPNEETTSVTGTQADELSPVPSTDIDTGAKNQPLQ